MTTDLPTRPETATQAIAEKQSPLPYQRSIPQISEQETKDFITPFAFRVDETLYGLPLAKPMRRGAAILIDLLLVAIFTALLEEALALCLAVFFFIVAYRKRKTAKKKRVSFRYAILGALFFIAFVTNESSWNVGNGKFNYPLWSNSSDPDDVNASSGIVVPVVVDGKSTELSIGELFKAGLNMKDVIANQMNDECTDLECYRDAYQGIPNVMLGLRLDEEQATDFVDDLIDSAKLSDGDKRILSNDLVQQYKVLAPAANIALDVAEKKLSESNAERAVDKDELSFVDIVRASIRDLGLSFGWAALYFSASLAWLKGKTPGKWLFGIRVIKLDGKAITLWESFERYGGYGAGFATGLLGFLQIFWDPNRQAIHDKISRTVVIRDKP